MNTTHGHSNTTKTYTASTVLDLDIVRATINRPVYGLEDAREHGRELRRLSARLLREAEARFHMEPGLYAKRCELATQAEEAAACYP